MASKLTKDEALTVRLGADVQFPITNNFVSVRGLDVLLQDMQRLLLTTPGERPHRPGYGCRLNAQIWENIDDVATNGPASIKNALTTFEPRVTVTAVTANVNRNSDLITFKIKFVVKANNTPVNLIFPFRVGTQLSFA